MNWAPLAYRTPAVALAIGILVGAVLQLAMQLPALAQAGHALPPRRRLSTIPACSKVGKLMVPAFFGMGVFQVNFFVDTIFATSSRMPDGQHHVACTSRTA